MTKRFDVLVTGAAGFIGSNFCERLCAAGRIVIGIDNFTSGSPTNIEQLYSVAKDRFHFIHSDICDAASIRTAVRDVRMVVHLAAQASVSRSFDDPVQTHQVNGLGFLNVLTAAGEAGVRLFVYASSCAVYGDCDNLPLTEDTPPRPLSPYAATKLLNEHYAAVLASQWPNMSCIGLRLFNIFGPRQSTTNGYAAVIPAWIQARFAGKSPELFGDGNTTRDFCHVDNVTELILSLDSDRQYPQHTVINIGGGRETSLRDLDSLMCHIMRDVIGIPDLLPIRMSPERPGDIQHSFADLWRARTLFGYNPRISLEQGLAALIAAEAEHHVSRRRQMVT